MNFSSSEKKAPYAIIAQTRQPKAQTAPNIPMKAAFEWVAVSRQAEYQHRQRRQQRQQANAEIMEKVKEIRKMHPQLGAGNYSINSVKRASCVGATGYLAC